MNHGLHEAILDRLLAGDFSDLSQNQDALDPVAAKIIALGAQLKSQQELSALRERGMQLIIDTMMQVAGGDFEIDLAFDREDEFLDALMLGLTMMAEELAALSQEFLKARDAAIAASATKSAFLASMSHELRTPLNAIIGYAELICEDAEIDGLDQIAADTEKILGASRHLVALISDILDLSKIEAGKIELVTEMFPVHEVCESLAATIAPLAASNGNTFELDIAPDLGEIFSDRTRLHQILLNLLSNANKFTDKGLVSFHAWRDAERELVCFEVKDSGIGISPARQAAIFEPFVQEDTTTTRRFGGTGLGLAISRHLAKMLGGDISVTSKQGEGSCFTLEVAISTDKKKSKKIIAQADEHAVISSLANDGRKRVMVVDDDPHVHELMQRSSLSEQVHLIPALNGKRALELLDSTILPDVIFLDIELPDTDGWTILAKLQQRDETRDIPVIIISVVDNSTLGFTLGATDYLVKPLDYSNLLPVILSRCGAENSGVVLVVDDDVNALDLARRALEPSGFEILQASSGQSAMRTLDTQRPDVILLDLMMPGMDGFQVYERLKEDPELASIPVVIFSAMELGSKERERLRDGNILAKSNGYGALSDVITHTLELSERRQGQEVN